MRRFFLATAFALSAASAQAFDFQSLSESVFGGGESGQTYGTEDPAAREITWNDLTPPLSAEAQAAAAKLNAMIDAMDDTEIVEAMALIDENGDVLSEELDGETVALEGYLIPLEYEVTAAQTFVLVPYMGACIHVPPPPPNQVVFIEYEEGIPMEALDENIWTPFRVTGTLRAVPMATELAEVGYQIAAGSIRVMEPDW